MDRCNRKHLEYSIYVSNRNGLGKCNRPHAGYMAVRHPCRDEPPSPRESSQELFAMSAEMDRRRSAGARPVGFARAGSTTLNICFSAAWGAASCRGRHLWWAGCVGL